MSHLVKRQTEIKSGNPNGKRGARPDFLRDNPLEPQTKCCLTRRRTEGTKEESRKNARKDEKAPFFINQDRRGEIYHELTSVAFYCADACQVKKQRFDFLHCPCRPFDVDFVDFCFLSIVKNAEIRTRGLSFFL